MNLSMREPMHSNMSQGKEPGQSVATPYDPWSWITLPRNRADTFDTLALDTAVNGRTASVGGGVWTADAGLVGDGAGGVKSTSSGQSAKHALNHTNCRVRCIWHPGATGNNQVSLFCRDILTTAFPNNGFILTTYPEHAAAPPTQALALFRSNTGTLVLLGSGYYTATIKRDWNVMELRCVGSTISGYLNGSLVIQVDNTGYGGASSKWGFLFAAQSNMDARVDYVDFIVL